MPGTNSFYPYGESSTNILNNSEYQTDSERSSGAQSGAIARSKMYNKQARQAAAGAYAVGALVAKSGKNADDSSATTLAANFQGAVSYQAAHFVASAVSVSGTTATATVAELATTAAADLPALFALSLVLDQALPAGASIAITSSLPDVTLSWPIYVGSEVLDSDTITGGAITLLIDTVGAKAFFKAGGGRYKPTDLPPLNPNFTMEITEGDTEDTVTVTADKLVISPTTDMLAGGQWEYGTEMSPAPGEGQNIKHWTREQLVTSGKPYDGLYLGDVTPSDAVNESIFWAPENDNGTVVLRPYLILSTDYLGGVYICPKNQNASWQGKWSSTGSRVLEGSDIQNWCEKTFLNSILHESVSKFVMECDLPVAYDGTIKAKCWPLSAKELNLSSGVPSDPGEAMPYFSSNSRRVFGGGIYFTRTTQASVNAYCVNGQGAIASQSLSTNAFYRPAFVLPKDFQIQQRPDGSYTVYNDYGLMTLKDIQASTSTKKVSLSILEKVNDGSNRVSKFIYAQNGYGDNDGALIVQETPFCMSPGNIDYSASTAQLYCDRYTTGTADGSVAYVLDSSVQSLLLDAYIKWMYVNTGENYLTKKGFILSAGDLSETYAGSNWGSGRVIPYFSTANNRIAKEPGGTNTGWWTRDSQSTNNIMQVDSAGAVTTLNKGSSSYVRFTFMLPLTAPIRLLADGTYDLVPEDPALSAQSISTMAEVQSDTAVQLKQIPQGSVLKIKENSQDVEFYVAKHDYESDLNGAGRTLMVRKDCYDNQVWDSGNVNAYAESDIDSWFNNTYKSLLDESIQEAIGTTKFHYTPGNGNNTVGTLERAVFALSVTELGQSNTYANTEGSALPIASTLQIAHQGGSATTQWTRSPVKNYTGDAWWLDSNGNISSITCNNSHGSRPVFTLPGDSYATANDDGTYTFIGADTGPTVSFTFTVPHGTQPVVRQYTYNYEEHYQTMLEGGVLPPLVDEGPTYSEVLSENTWAQIAQAVADKDPILDVWQIGDTKDEVIAGETLTFAIMGKNMDDLADGSGKAGLTFGMTQLMASTRQMNSSNTNSGSFAGSAMYSWLSGTIYPNLPTELKDAIKAVNKKTSSGGGSSAIRTDAMYLWLFSEIEVFGSTTYSYAGEGTQYPYFATSAERIKRLSNGAGAASIWWERSPNRNNSQYFCYVDTSGSAGRKAAGASGSIGVCFGFCI